MISYSTQSDDRKGSNKQRMSIVKVLLLPTVVVNLVCGFEPSKSCCYPNVISKDHVFNDDPVGRPEHMSDESWTLSETRDYAQRKSYYNFHGHDGRDSILYKDDMYYAWDVNGVCVKGPANGFSDPCLENVFENLKSETDEDSGERLDHWSSPFLDIVYVVRPGCVPVREYRTSRDEITDQATYHNVKLGNEVDVSVFEKDISQCTDAK